MTDRTQDTVCAFKGCGQHESHTNHSQCFLKTELGRQHDDRPDCHAFRPTVATFDDSQTVTVTFSVALPKSNTVESVAQAFEAFVEYVKRSDGYPDGLLGDIPDFNSKWKNPNNV